MLLGSLQEFSSTSSVGQYRIIANYVPACTSHVPLLAISLDSLSDWLWLTLLLGLKLHYEFVEADLHQFLLAFLMVVILMPFVRAYRVCSHSQELALDCLDFLEVL
jgi:hypothetical protein